MEMPKSNKKVMNIGEFRTMSFSCGKEAVQGTIPRMKLMRKLHEKTCDICSKSGDVTISGGITNRTNGISGLDVSLARINEYMS
jgi:hypothetical protein